eukprot:gene657-3965_t
MPIESDHTFKVILLGDTQVGKTSLILRFVDDIFATHDTASASVGAQFKIRTMMIDSKLIKWHLSDSSGSDRFRTITGTFLRAGDVILLVFDLSSEETFESVQSWLDEFKKNARSDALAVLVGCKSDCDRQVDMETIIEFAKLHKLMYFETSSLKSNGINEMFESIGAQLVAIYEKTHAHKGDSIRGFGAAHSGFLVKRGTRWPHKWQKRWFVLDDKQLSYSRGMEKDSVVLGSIELDTLIGISTDSQDPYFGISLRTPDRTLKIRTESIAMRDEWLNKLNDTVRILPDSRIKLQNLVPNLQRGDIVFRAILKPTNLPVSVHHPTLDKLTETDKTVDYYRFIRNLKKLGAGHHNIIGFHGFTSLPIPFQKEDVSTAMQQQLSKHLITTAPAIVLDLYETPMPDVFFTDAIPQTLQQALKAMIQISSAVEYLHNHSLVHTDITASNIMCSRDRSLKLRVLPSCRSFVRKNEFTGKQGQPGYTSPESRNGEKWNSMVDVFALSVLFFEIANQRSAYFYPGSECDRCKDIPVGMEPKAHHIVHEAASNAVVQQLIASTQVLNPKSRPVARKIVAALQSELVQHQETEQ